MTPRAGAKTAQDELVEALIGEVLVEDASPNDKTLAEHDKEEHPDGFNPETDTCKFRERIATETEEDKADIENSADAPKEVGNGISNSHFPKPMGISHIFTGSAADYDKPSLLKVGTGEGSQVYGWGLYGSTVRGVAADYATADAGRKRGRRTHLVADVKYDGKPIRDIDGLRSEHLGLIARLEDYGSIDKVMESYEFFDQRGKLRESEKRDYEFLKENKEHFSLVENAPLPEYLYEQTFFTNRAEGDESHLLKWYEDLPKEQVDWIAQEFAKEGFFVASFSKLKGWTVLDRASGKKLSVWDKRESGEAYEAIAKFLGSPQAASEFLARAGIDGVKYPVDSYGKTVKDGDKAGWNYVSFRDDNIRIDKKYVDGQKMFDYQELMNKNHSDMDPMAVLSYLTRLGSPEEMAAEFARIMESGKIENDKSVQDELVEALVMDADTLKDQTLQEHDRIHHKEGYHEGDTCKFRDKIKEETPEDKADEVYVEGKGGQKDNNKPSIIDKLKQEIAKVRDAYESPNGNRSQEWLKAPNGADSNLSKDLWVFVRTPSFKKWFGDWENNPEHASKVLDENGEPMVLYHCSDESDISEFIVPWEGPIEWDGLPGLFFSPKPQTAYGKNVYSVFLNIRRPTDMDGKGERRTINGRSLAKLEEFGKQYEDSIKANEKEFKFSDDGSLKITDKGLDSLRSDGYYGTLAEDGTKEYAVLSPQQVMMIPKNVDGKGDGAASGKGDKTEKAEDNKPLVTPEEDAAYMEAVERGDIEAATRMLKDTAVKQGYTVSAFHGTPTGGFSVFDQRKIGSNTGMGRGAFSFTSNKEMAEKYKNAWDEQTRASLLVSDLNSLLLKHDSPEIRKLFGNYDRDVAVVFDPSIVIGEGALEHDFIEFDEDWKENNPKLYASDEEAKKAKEAAYLEGVRKYLVDMLKKIERNNPEVGRKFFTDAFDMLESSRYDIKPTVYSVFLKTPTLELSADSKDFNKKATEANFGTDSDVAVLHLDNGEDRYFVHNPTAIKSADPVTYDDNGNVIPLSRRFDSGDDIRGDVSGASNFIEMMKSLHPDVNPDKLLSKLKSLGSREEMERAVAQILGGAKST